MRVKTSAMLALAAVVTGSLAAAAPASAETTWLCSPEESPNPCRESNETTVQEPDGSSRVENPPLPADPPIDCFYVYPTVSEQPGTNANKDKDPEQVAIARYQAARFSQRCRVFAPIYRQLTLASIARGDEEARAAGGKIAYADLREAWLEYRRRFNGGRGVVLIGHSQGTRMLRNLVRQEIDRKPAVRRLLVSALLLGQNVLVRTGRRDGGDFQHVSACVRPNQTGCVIAWSAFNEPPPENARFGRSPAGDTTGHGFPAGPGYEVLCTNPASLAANTRKPLTTYLRSEPYPGVIGALLVVMYGGPPPSAPTPWLQPSERYTGRCERSAGANVLMIESIGAARRLNPSPDDSWGLHLADVNLALGELVGIVGSQGRAYRAKSGRCLARRSPIGPRNIGRIRLGRTRARLRRLRVQPSSRTRRSYRYCVKRSRGRVAAVLSSAGRRGKTRLVATTARSHRMRRVGRGVSTRRFARRFPRRTRIARDLWRASPTSRRIFGTRGGMVRFVAVADMRLLRSPRMLRRYLRLAGLR